MSHKKIFSGSWFPKIQGDQSTMQPTESRGNPMHSPLVVLILTANVWNAQMVHSMVLNIKITALCAFLIFMVGMVLSLFSIIFLFRLFGLWYHFMHIFISFTTPWKSVSLLQSKENLSVLAICFSIIKETTFGYLFFLSL